MTTDPKANWPGPTPNGFVRLTQHPAPAGILGPNARRTPYWHYGLWACDGSRPMGGTAGADFDAALAHVRKMALSKGMADPHIEVVSMSGHRRQYPPRKLEAACPAN